MRAGFLQIDGGRVETGWWGPGPDEAATLVLLHEGLGSVALWRDVPARLAEATGWGVFAYSRFGYGYSDSATLPRPLNYMQDEALLVLPEVLLAAGIRRAVLVGHSDGGSIAAVYAGSRPPAQTVAPLPTAMPERPSAVPGQSFVIPGQPFDSPGLPTIVVPGLDPGTGPNASEVQGDPRSKPGNETSLLGLVTIAAHFIVEDLNIASIREIKDTYETGTLRPRLARYHRDVDVAFRGWNDVWLDPGFRDFDITGYLPHIQVPVLALQGATDPYGTDAQLHVLEANVRVPVTIRVISDARHSPHLEAPDATLTSITDFVARLPRGVST